MDSYNQPTWGSDFEEYSQRDFEPCVSVVSEQDIAKSLGLYGVPPLSSLENMLCGSTIQGGKSASQNIGLGDVMRILRKYITINPIKIFANFYGVVCVRLVLHAVCLGILKETKNLRNLFRSVDQSISGGEFTQVVATEALEVALQESRNERLSEKFDRIFTGPSFSVNDSASEPDLLLLTRLFWEDQSSFFALNACGYLPGSALLLHAIFKRAVVPARTRPQMCLHLHDLQTRLYLVGSNRDRELLWLTFLSIGQNSGKSGGPNKPPIDPKDSWAVYRAYSGLLLALQKDKTNARALPVSMTRFLASYTITLVGLVDSITIEEISMVLYQAFQYLWLTFDCRGTMPLNVHNAIWFSASHLFVYVT
ncbi:hypothetical protein FRC12_002068 [Ceratobasidium sp. 428]|nr:hypothetical protein FRC12_002068 [Ceratobasidium sp. 428]